eukprot:GDKI01039677.1.p1 GENE.GDKI01039677.1~~GDKI01039677.1.p1  ORF type:complete len:319 (-),score=94.36 GDKI01039677.1:145-1101(-)
MQDRLAELRELAVAKNNPAALLLAQQGGQAVSVAAQREREKVKDLEQQAANAEKGSDFMADYFQKVGRIKTSIGQVRSKVEEIRGLKQEAIQATSPEKEKDISTHLEGLLSSTSVLTATIKKELEALKAENQTFAAKHKNSSEARIRDNMQGALTRKFRDVLTAYQAVQTEYKQDVQQKVTRQVRIVYPEASDEDVQQIVENGGASTAIQIRISKGHESLKGALADIQDKYRDIRRLEASVEELKQMFLELAALVEHQGDLLDQIEFNVQAAKEYTKKAEAELVAARKYQESRKKRMCCLTMCLLILVIVIVAPIMAK